MLELIIEALLTQNSAKLALRILEARPTMTSPILKIKTLFANDLLSDAFHFARSKNDESLLELFFNCCLCDGKFGIIRDLALSEKEGRLVQNILKRSKTQGAENLNFVYLLQKSKYIEAVSYMDELSKTKYSNRYTSSASTNRNTMETPQLVLSAFNTTMTPVTQGLTDVYFRIKNKIKQKDTDVMAPVPFSCQLIKQNANNLLGGIYHSSALSAHFATYYWNELDDEKKKAANCSGLLNSNNAPFLRKAQVETNVHDFVNENIISYPQVYKIREKRTLSETDLLNNSLEHERCLQQQQQQENPKKKRRLLGHEIIKDLGHFMNMNRINHNLNVDSFNLNKDTTPEEEDTDEQEQLITDSYIVKPLSKNYKPVISLAVGIQGILKTNVSDVSSERSATHAEEEKNLRFDLPVSHEESMSDDSEKAPTNLNSSRAISVDSTVNSKTSLETDEEEDNFYSPIASRNTSMLLSGPMSTHVDSSPKSSVSSKYNFLNGPHPRKPLARLSSERSEKSLTPEPVPSRLTQGELNTSKTLRKTPETSSGFASLNEQSKYSSTTYVSCKESILENSKASSSGYNSIEQQQSTCTTLYKTCTVNPQNSSVSTKITSSNSSKINEFVPKVSSSKVGETVSKIPVSAVASYVKLSECSTVLGSITHMESHIESSSYFAQPSHNVPGKSITKPVQPNNSMMMDTTLGMSSYDITFLDSTAQKHLQSPPDAGSETGAEMEKYCTAQEELFNEALQSKTHFISEESGDAYEYTCSKENNDNKKFALPAMEEVICLTSSNSGDYEASETVEDSPRREENSSEFVQEVGSESNESGKSKSIDEESNDTPTVTEQNSEEASVESTSVVTKYEEKNVKDIQCTESENQSDIHDKNKDNLDDNKSDLVTVASPEKQSSNFDENEAEMSVLKVDDDESNLDGDQLKLQEQNTDTETIVLKEGEKKEFEKISHRSVRGTSVPPVVQNSDGSDNLTPKRRNDRGVSVPPQIAHIEEENLTPRRNTPRNRRYVRASSVQCDDTDNSTTKPINTRRRSILLDAINEDSSLLSALDSPSTRTRSRARLNSMDSELDSSIVSNTEAITKPQIKRNRRVSVTSNVSEQNEQTPVKRTRRASISSDNASQTPKTRKAGSVLKETLDEGSNKAKEKKGKSPDSEKQSTYQSARRLTRTQLAMLEKSNAVAAKVGSTIEQSSPPKRIIKRRSSRSNSTNHAESDDNESISSHMTVGSGKQRRITRSSLKNKVNI